MSEIQLNVRLDRLLGYLDFQKAELNALFRTKMSIFDTKSTINSYSMISHTIKPHIKPYYAILLNIVPRSNPIYREPGIMDASVDIYRFHRWRHREKMKGTCHPTYILNNTRDNSQKEGSDLVKIYSLWIYSGD